MEETLGTPRRHEAGEGTVCVHKYRVRLGWRIIKGNLGCSTATYLKT